jgi:hypothetical protein
MKNSDKKQSYQAAVAREAEKLLDDPRFDGWRSQSRRRALVIGAIISIAATIALCLYDNPALALIAIVISAGFWWVLRKVVRGFADLPDKFIDERIRAVRNEHYLFAYRILNALTLVVVLAMYMAVDGARIQWQIGSNHVHALFWAILLLSAMLPSMLLAWSQREV